MKKRMATSLLVLAGLIASLVTISKLSAAPMANGFKDIFRHQVMMIENIDFVEIGSNLGGYRASKMGNAAGAAFEFVRVDLKKSAFLEHLTFSFADHVKSNDVCAGTSTIVARLNQGMCLTMIDACKFQIVGQLQVVQNQPKGQGGCPECARTLTVPATIIVDFCTEKIEVRFTLPAGCNRPEVKYTIRLTTQKAQVMVAPSPIPAMCGPVGSPSPVK